MNERFKFCELQVVDLVKGKNELSSFRCELNLNSCLFFGILGEGKISLVVNFL